jgi:hypothetical protein
MPWRQSRAGRRATQTVIASNLVREVEEEEIQLFRHTSSIQTDGQFCAVYSGVRKSYRMGVRQLVVVLA